MTPQQRADIWLKLWRELRDLGCSPEQRDRIIDREYGVAATRRTVLELDVGCRTFETT